MYGLFGLLNDNIDSSILLANMLIWATFAESMSIFSFYIDHCRVKKRDMKNRNTDLKKSKSKCLMVITWRLGAISRVDEKLPKSPRKKQVRIKALTKKSGITHSWKQPRNVTSNKTAQFVKKFTRPDIVYTMPVMKDEITIWENGTTKHERKCYLTMFLQEAYKIYTESPVFDKAKFSKFCDLLQKNVLLKKESPVDQRKCLIHEKFVNMLTNLSILYF